MTTLPQSGALRVLLVAEHASVRLGGEASLPFHSFRVLRARGVDAYLLVHERTRSELLEAFPTETDRMLFVADTVLHRLLYRWSLVLPRRIAEATLGTLNQLLTQWVQRRLLRPLLTANTVVHQPMPVSPRAPSLLYGLGAPVVLGPMNGGMEYPPAFRAAEPALVRVAVAAGRALSGLVNTVLPGKRDAALLLVANPRTRAALPVRPRGRVEQLVENGVDLECWPAQAASFDPGPARFLFIGRLVDWKALDVVLHALQHVPSATLDVVGDGAMRAPWEALTRDLALGGRVRFLGWRTQTECAALLAASTALVLPSLFECGGAVVLEAMSVGRPVIATRWGGPADYLDDACGILVTPASRDALIQGFFHGMRRLAASPELCHTLGQNGREKVQQLYDWDRKVDALMGFYAAALPPVNTGEPA